MSLQSLKKNKENNIQYSTERVATLYRKLSSSKIFDLTIRVNRKRPHSTYKGVDMSFLNRAVSKFMKDEYAKSEDMGELARGGHIFINLKRKNEWESKIEYTIRGNFYEINFYISTEELSQRDLEQVLDLGFYFSKWKSHFIKERD